MGPPRTIVVLGISQRSGTNYLANLLLCHRGCVAPPAPLREDHLLRDASLLTRYADATSRRWLPRWGDRQAGRTALLRHVGDGLLEFLASGAGGRRVVTKTPSVENLDLYPELFPGACVLLLVRDGRSVTESLVAGFGAPFGLAVRIWREGARRILAFEEAHRDRHDLKFSIVRYESLLADLEAEMARILTFCDLDPAGFDADAARRLPVLGSSFGGTKRATWEEAGAADAEEGSDPVARWASWPTRRHDRFLWLAGAEQAALGYGRGDGSRAGRVRNLVLDAAWPLRRGYIAVRAATLGRYIDRRARRRALRAASEEGTAPH